MSKEFRKALADYIAATSIVLHDLSESHYLNGSNAKSVKLLMSAGDTLINELHKEQAPPVVPPAPPAA